MILVSACLLGEKCRYDGQGNHSDTVVNALEDREYLAVCPEVAGGLGIPRPPAELTGDRVIRADRTDVTHAFQAGVERCMDLVDQFAVTSAILKARSPACGCGKIYNGHFNQTLIDGDGLLARALKAHGISCRTEEDLPAVQNDD